MRRPKTGRRKTRKGPVADFAIFRERRTSFSLDLGEIRPSEFVRTRRKATLRVGTGFMEFRQIPRGRGFSLLGFYALFKSYVDVLVG